MINIQEVIIHLEKKITEYRYHQKRTQKAKATIFNATQLLSTFKTHIQQEVGNLLKAYRIEMTQEIINIGQSMNGVIQKTREEREGEVLELRREIERQHNVISTMRKEVEDLQELMIMQTMQNNAQRDQPVTDSPKKQDNREREERQAECSPQGRTFGGLEIIEQQTQRTLMSSARSQEQLCTTDAFIRIEEQQQQQPCFQRQPLPEFNYHPPSSNYEEASSSSIRTHSESSPSEWPSQEGVVSKLEQMMQLSHFSHRQHSHEEPFPQYQSLPISIDYLAPEPCHTWEGQEEEHLRDITNSHSQTEHQRQSRSKMFLQEFRRTFNKCLTSNPSRKGSKDNTNPKSTKSSGREQGLKDSQKLISEMLKDIDNNNKFNVGARKAEVRYEGGRKGGSREGQGTLYYSNGLSYEGEFRGNQRHGYGVLRFNQIEIYRGEWQADELSGQGKIRNVAVINRRKNQTGGSPLLRWVSYCGYFRNNRFQGEGTLYLQGGEKFLGRFICGSACGEGTLYRKNGQVETGIWRNNQLYETF